VVLYFVWPYSPGRLSTPEILELLANEPFAGFMSLDLSMVVIVPINIVVFIALYVALRRVNHSYALIALVLGAIAIPTVIISRPVLELLELGRAYAVAATPAEQEPAVTLAEGLLLYYEGTAWVLQTLLLLTPGLIFALLMRKSPDFSRATAIVGIVISAAGFGFVVPGADALFLFINTIGTIVWYPMVAVSFRRMAAETRGEG
jgi:hypothetical protein